MMCSTCALAQTGPAAAAGVNTENSASINPEMMVKQFPPDQAGEAQKMREKIKVDEIIEKLIPVYDHNFSSEDLQGLINFYQSSLGQRLIQKLPQVMRESVEISTAYMESKLGANTPPTAEETAKQ